MSGRPAGSRPRFLALVGATATGKTALSLELARRLDAEIVSMDSRQVYRGMDIGTDKVGPEARAAVPHHGLDLVEPSERYSAGRFARDARGWIAGIEERGRLPLLVGGTGFFLRALVEPIFEEPPLDEARRARLRRWLKDRDRPTLERWVAALDRERAPLAREGGPQRMSRTLEVALLTGRPLSWWHRAAGPDGEAIPGVAVVLELPPGDLRRRIDERVGRMRERGLVDEVRSLRARGYGPDDPGMSATGYREIISHLQGETSLDEALEEIRAATRRYARRQRTWFRHQLPPDTVRVSADEPLETQAGHVLRAWEAAGGTRSAPRAPGARR